MGLETLKGLSKLGQYQIVHMDQLKELHPEMFDESGAMDWKIFEREIRPFSYIYARHDKHSLSFTLQTGPIKEVGVNGCQIDALILAAKTIIEGLNKKFPCRENAIVITKLDEALHWLEHRKKDREERGVEGFDKL